MWPSWVRQGIQLRNLPTVFQSKDYFLLGQKLSPLGLWNPFVHMKQSSCCRAPRLSFFFHSANRWKSKRKAYGPVNISLKLKWGPVSCANDAHFPLIQVLKAWILGTKTKFCLCLSNKLWTVRQNGCTSLGIINLVITWVYLTMPSANQIT
jgi:hypothetical protein